VVQAGIVELVGVLRLKGEVGLADVGGLTGLVALVWVCDVYSHSSSPEGCPCKDSVERSQAKPDLRPAAFSLGNVFLDFKKRNKQMVSK